MSEPAAIRTENLTKFYGKNRGLLDLNLEVRPGEVFGFLGPNGAGKTTTIRLLLDLIRPTRGEARVLGINPRTSPEEVHRRTGYLPGELALYEQLTGKEVLTFCASMRGGIDWAYVRQLCERLDIDLSRHMSELSRGNKQKIGVLLAFFHRPELLILDEPTSSLDPLVQQEVHHLFREATEEGRTIFLSSHVLSEVERVADRVGIIRDGTLVAVESMKTLKDRALRRVEVTFAQAVPTDSFAGLPGVRSVQDNGTVLRLAVEGSMDALVKALGRHEVESLTSHEADLEEIFLSYYGVTGDEDAT
ncbi:MAG: ABC transporter ATP-binding protein [Actinomycetota bacterium]